jgi:hypothetical protein
MAVTMDGAFRSGPGNDSLIPDLISSVHVLPRGKIKPGAELLLDYDYQPGALGHHDYDLFAGLPDHLPWPPPNSSAALKPMHLTPSPTPSRGSTSRRLSRGGHRRRTMAKVGATADGRNEAMLGDTHSNLHEGKGSGSFTEPLYYAGHKQKLEALIDLFATRGDPLVGIHLNHDEINGAETPFVHALFNFIRTKNRIFAKTDPGQAGKVGNSHVSAGVARDRRSLLSNLTNGELLMESVNNLTAVIVDKQPGIIPFVYDDMCVKPFFDTP